MKNEFVLALNEVLEEKQLPREVVLDALKAAMVSAYRRAVNASNAQHVEAVIDADTGAVTILAEKEVVESVDDSRTEVSLVDALKVDPEAQVGGMVIVETTPTNFGRVAAQTARQVIQQRIREAEREVQYEHFSEQVGEILSGVVQAINAQGVTMGLEMKAEGLMPRNQQIPRERFRVHDRVRILISEVKSTTRGPQIILSRAHKNFLRRLLENEVPEIYHGMVEIRSIAREPGHRSKVAVAALQPGVDPVGACVGIRGVRIQAIVRELNDEKIDVIEWNQDPTLFIAKALSPARVAGVYLSEILGGTKTATVVVPEDQLSLAIGRDGQNARLAAKLTSWRIDIKSLPEASTDAIYRLSNDPEYADLAVEEEEIIPQVEIILSKKAEGRPITPEEYQLLTKFVDRVERGVMLKREAEKRAEEERKRVAMANIPVAAFDVPFEDFEISDRIYTVISSVGFESVGDLMLQLKMDPDSILALHGMGPKGWAKLTQVVDDLIARMREEEQAAQEQAVLDQAALEQAEIEPESEEPGIEDEQVQIEGDEVAASQEALEAEEVASAEEMPQAEAPQVPEEKVDVAEDVVGDDEGIESIEELITESVEDLETGLIDDDYVDEESSEDMKAAKKKKKKYIEIEYDPDQDVTLVRRKRKRDDEQTWEDEW